MRVLFIEKITIIALLRIALIGRSFSLILYFDKASPMQLKMLELFRKIDLLRGGASQLTYHIGDIRNSTGESEYGKILERAKEICRLIRLEKLEQDPILDTMKSAWTKDKILLYFDRIVESEITSECLRLGLIRWLIKNKMNLPDAEVFLLIEYKHWLSYLEEEARIQDIHLMTFWNTGFLRNSSRIARRVFSTLGKVIHVLMTKSKETLQTSSIQEYEAIKPPAATLAMRYWHRNLQFDPTERSEFFWMNGVNIPTEDVLLYDYVSDKSIDTETLRTLNVRGIRILGHGPKIQSPIPSLRIGAVFARISWELIEAFMRCVFQRNVPSRYILGKLVILAVEYAYWYDFFLSNRVKVNIGTLNTSVGQVLAMDQLGGVTMSYQYSASNLFYPTKLLSAGENIQFVFSSAYENLYKDINAPVEYIVKTGFVYDGAIRVLRRINRSGAMRQRLQGNGAKFIICFFDENTVNRWDILCSNDDAVQDYEFLIKWLLDDPTLGIVFKPKMSINLFERIDAISELIDYARQTGRCEFLTSEMIYGNIFPAEAALTADICIGKLVGTSAALEAKLTGTPTILVDTEGLRSHPFYQWGKERILFDNWKSLREAVELYREHPEAESKLGNWNPELDEMDPFQDGQAGLRMGKFVAWVYDALKKGIHRNQAMAEAAAKYGKRWGSSHVTLRNN